MIARVNFYKPSDSSRLEGIVQPSLPRAFVVIQRKLGTRWVTVAEGRTTASGEFSIRVALGWITVDSPRSAPGPPWSHAVASRRVGVWKHFAVSSWALVGSTWERAGVSRASRSGSSRRPMPHGRGPGTSVTGGTRRSPGAACAVVVSVPTSSRLFRWRRVFQGVAFAELHSRTARSCPCRTIRCKGPGSTSGTSRRSLRLAGVASRRLHQLPPGPRGRDRLRHRHDSVPEFGGPSRRIRTFVQSRADVDSAFGHGTLVAGEIAGRLRPRDRGWCLPLGSCSSPRSSGGRAGFRWTLRHGRSGGRLTGVRA